MDSKTVIVYCLMLRVHRGCKQSRFSVKTDFQKPLFFNVSNITYEI